MLTLTYRAYLTSLAISALQFWLGLRFKSFLVPIGIGLLFSILGMVNMIGYKVIDAEKFLFTFSAFVFFKDNVLKIPATLWYTVGYTVTILAIGFLDFRRPRER